ncbi:MAG: hypothetical protein ACR2PH_03595 [Desulfobulbia bacterium]
MKNTHIILGLVKAVAPAVFKTASAECETGTHSVDTTIRIKGTVTKGEEYEQVQHMKVDQWAMIAVLLSKVNGVTVDSVVREINSVEKDAITEIKKKAQEAMDKVKAPAKVKTAGKVTGKITYEVVEVSEKLESSKTAIDETATETETA